MYGLQPRQATDKDIRSIIDAFGQAARRAMAAGFDGIHIHGGNGYLISEFSSPITNQRTDAWGGDAERRGAFLVGVYEAVRAAVGPDLPITARIGIGDSIPGGLTPDETIPRLRRLADSGLDGIEVSYGIMQSYLENIRPYVAVGARQAVKNVLVQRLARPRGAEAYYRHFARLVKHAVDIPVILVGGIRTTETMTDILNSGDADYLALARPFIREPDLANKLIEGRTGMVECVSCNMCLAHDGFDPLRCWRTSPAAVAQHVYTHYIRKKR
jgi:2,4-dienoyl-CoA reductase-like NADH-dependent reductase (Old Yellow Enzyme family)